MKMMKNRINLVLNKKEGNKWKMMRRKVNLKEAGIAKVVLKRKKQSIINHMLLNLKL